jgi:hypothetical protein
MNRKGSIDLQPRLGQPKHSSKIYGLADEFLHDAFVSQLCRYFVRRSQRDRRESRIPSQKSRNDKRAPEGARFRLACPEAPAFPERLAGLLVSLCLYFRPAASVTACVQAPVGSLVMTGDSPPAASSVATVRL